MIDVGAIAAAAVAWIQGQALQAGQSALDAGRQTAMDWVTDKLTSPAGQEAVADVTAAPEESENWDALKTQLIKLLKKQPELAEELQKLLSGEARSAGLSATVTGDQNTVAQADRQSTIHIQR